MSSLAEALDAGSTGGASLHPMLVALEGSGSLGAPLISLQQAQQAAFNALPPSVQGVINAGLADASTAAPAIALGQTIASGGVPTEAEVIGGLAAATTLTLGPIAGAAVGAIGAVVAGVQALMTDLFTSLGLYDNAPSYTYIGLLRAGIDPIPFGPTDPFWIDCGSGAKVSNFYFHGDAHHPALSGGFNGTMIGLLGMALCRSGIAPLTDGCMPPAVGPPTPPPSDFERYFAVLLARDLSYWANAQGYVPPRLLLEGALSAWNSSHASTTTDTFAMPTQQQQDQADSSHSNLVSWVLGPAGDAVNRQATGNWTRSAAITVNTGPSTASTTATGPGAASASTSSAGPVVAVLAIGAAVAGGIWAVATGRLPWLKL